MPLRLDIKKKLSTRTDRVKSVDISTSEPWVLIGLYTGHLQIWNYETQQLVKSFEVADQTPIRFAKFISRKQWIICGSDDMIVRIFSINTMEKLREFEAHMDYIRSLEVHSIHPYVLTSSDDMQIKMWDWEKQWQNVQSFDGHSHYVMMVKFNPKDTNTFASASLDKSVKVWSLGSPLPNFSLEGHTAGVNCVDYFQGGDKPYIASGSDDFTVKIWDYQTKACVHTLQGHTNNVSAAVFHNTLPIILSGSEDGTVRVWHSTTYRLESTLNYGYERCWALGVSQFSNKVACGFDEGIVVLQMGREMPVCSMDVQGKIILATAKDFQTGAVLRNLDDQPVVDGEVLDVAFKTSGPTEAHLSMLEHNLNGRFVVACGDGEYIIYTSQALRNKSFGQALDFGWSGKSPNDYCVRDQTNRIHIFQDFKETHAFTFSNGSAEQLFGGHLVGVSNQDSITFFSWQTGKEVYKIDVCPKQVFWNEAGDKLCLACEESFFILSCDLENDQQQMTFEYLDEVPELAKTGQWVGECFLYTNASHRLNYYVGGEVFTIAHMDHEQHLLGFLKNRVFLMDKNRQVISFLLLESVLRYQTAVVRTNFVLANQILQEIPKSQYGKIARFLEAKGFKEQALSVATDPEHKFELALSLEKFSVALELMQKELVLDTSTFGAEDIQAKWKQLGDLALARGNVNLATECAELGNDLASLLLIHSSTGNLAGLANLLSRAQKEGFTNIAFCTALLLKDYEQCIAVLRSCKRIPEATFMALNYCPSLVGELTQEWKREMVESGHGLGLRIANALANPMEHPELFPGFAEALRNEVKSSQSGGGGAGLKRAVLETPPTEPPAKREVPAAAVVAPVVQEKPVEVMRPTPPMVVAATPAAVAAPVLVSPPAVVVVDEVEEEELINSVVEESIQQALVEEEEEDVSVPVPASVPTATKKEEDVPAPVPASAPTATKKEEDVPAPVPASAPTATKKEEVVLEEDDDVDEDDNDDEVDLDEEDDHGQVLSDNELGLEEDWE